MQYDILICDEFIIKMENYIQYNPEGEAVKSFELLLDTRKYCLPSILMEKGVYIRFNNISESFFLFLTTILIRIKNSNNSHRAASKLMPLLN